MKYPRYNKSEDQRVILSDKDIEKIKFLYKNGMSMRSIAKEFNTSHTTISYHVKNQEFRDTLNKKRYQEIKKKINSDPKYKKERKVKNRSFMKNKLKRSPDMKVYKGKITYKWKKKKLIEDEDFKKKTRQQSLNSYYKKKQVKNES
jgi:IS30 family transposase